MSDLIRRQAADVPDTNVGDSDTIYRQAAIDATWFEPSYTDPLNVLTEVRDRLKMLPSAQLEERTQKRTETHACDCISRQSVKDWLLRWEGYIDKDIIARMQGRVIDIPPAQSMDVQEAYYLGKIDGIKECTERLKRVTEEIDNERNKDRSDQQAGGN